MKKGIKIILVCVLLCATLLCGVKLVSHNFFIAATNEVEDINNFVNEIKSLSCSIDNLGEDSIRFNNIGNKVVDYDDERADKVIELDVINERPEYNEEKEQLFVIDGEYRVYSKFALKRLIVNGNVVDTFGANKHIMGYLDYNILCYDTEEQTAYAYNEFRKNNTLIVNADEIITAESYADNEYNYDNFDSWGAEAIEVGGYLDYLSDELTADDEVVVAVLDTGINTCHEKFEDRLLVKNGSYVGSSYYTSKYTYSGYTFEDGQGHGTHVSGIICDLTPSNVKILPIKILSDEGSGSSVNIIAGMAELSNYKQTYNIVCANMSLGGSASNSGISSYSAAIEDLYNLNILTVVAAGNDAMDAKYHTPATIDLAVTVSSLKRDNYTNKAVFDASYSNFGQDIDIAAPGSDIYAACIGVSNGEHPTAYAIKSGTSMATPHVAGGIALLYLDPKNSDCTAHEIEELLYDYAVDAGENGWDQYYGNGILNLKLFEGDVYDKEITFYNGATKLECTDNFINYTEGFTISIECSDPRYVLYYTLDGTMPSVGDNQYEGPLYSEEITTNGTLYLTVVGYRCKDGNIKERTRPFILKYFNSTTPLEDVFTIAASGYVSNYIGHYDGYITMPEIMGGYIVKSLAHNLFYESELTGLTLPSSCKTFNGSLFVDAPNIRYLYAEGLTYAYGIMFKNCPGIEIISDNISDINGMNGVYVPSLKHCYGSAFVSCSNLEKVSLLNLETIGTFAFGDCVSLEVCELPSIIEVSNNLFYNCISLKSFSIGANVEKIGTSAFYNCISLNNFVVDANNGVIVTDGLALFYNNSVYAFALNNIDIVYSTPNKYMIGNVNYTITKIMQGAFAYCDLTQLSIPSTITHIYDLAFSYSSIDILEYKTPNCSSSGYAVLVDGVYEVAPLFYMTTIGTIHINDNVVNVPMYMFSYSIFDSLVINSYSTTFEERAFREHYAYMYDIILNFEEAIDSNYLTMMTKANNYIQYVEYVSLKNQCDLFAENSWVVSYVGVSGDYYIYKNGISKYNITASAGNNGSISNAGTTSYYYGDTILVEFYPNPGYVVNSITVDGESLEGSSLTNAIDIGYTFNVIYSNHTISVDFKPDIYTITYNDNYNGVIKTEQLRQNQKIELEEIQRNDYIFTGWYLDQETTTKFRYDYMPNSDLQLYAGWQAINTHIITATSGENGSITPSGEVECDKYGSKLFEFEPANGYKVKSIEIDGVLLSGEDFTDAINNGYLFENIVNNHSIHVEFEEREYLLTLDFNCTELENVEVYYKYRDVLVIETPTRELYNFEGWYVNSTLTVAFSGTMMPMRDLTLYAKWSLKTFTVTAIAGDNGYISPGGTTTYYYNQSQVFTFSPNMGYRVDSIFVDDVKLIGPTLNDAILNGYIMTEMIGDHAIEVYFTKAAYSILFVKNNGEKDNNVSYYYQDDIEIPLSPYKEGYNFEGWYLDEQFTRLFDYEKMPARNFMVYAKYDIIKNIITATAESGGIIMPTGENYVDYNGNQTFYFRPESGYVVSYIEIDGVVLNDTQIKDARDNGYKFDRVKEHHTINVKFSEKYNEIVLTVEGEGTFVCDDDIKFIEYGDDRLFYVAGNFNKYNVEVYVNNELVEIDKNKTVLISNIKQDTIVLVKFVYNEDYNKTVMTYVGIGAGTIGVGLLWGIFSIIRRIRRKDYFF